MKYVQSADGTIYQVHDTGAWKDCTVLPNTEGKRLYREQACAQLRSMLKPGQTVYTVLRHVSSSGMTRHIRVLVPVVELRHPNGTAYVGKRVPVIRDITSLVARATDTRLSNDHSLVVGGCGMDMGFHVVYNLGRSLWPKGTRKPHGSRNGSPDTDGGYALKQEWT